MGESYRMNHLNALALRGLNKYRRRDRHSAAAERNSALPRSLKLDIKRDILDEDLEEREV